MSDVIVLCEGQTKREFCRSVVAPHVGALGLALAGTLVGKPGRKRGGIRDWSVYRGELQRLAKERSDRHVSVLVDYYAMPDSWPGRTEARALAPADRGRHVEERLRADLADELGDRFVPGVQLHEFESLLFVKPEVSANTLAAAGSSVQAPALRDRLAAIVAECGGSAEQIDDSPEGAPSRRLAQLLPDYDKVFWGVLAAKAITINDLRQAAPGSIAG